MVHSFSIHSMAEARPHTMTHSKPSYGSMLTMALCWQLVVYALAVGGIFPEVYALLGIPWNSTGFINVVGTTAGLVLLELPLVAVLAGWFWRHRRTRRRDVNAPFDDRKGT
jgi:hypothetical protein